MIWIIAPAVFVLLTAPILYWWRFVREARQEGAPWEDIMTAVSVEMDEPGRSGHWNVFIGGYSLLVTVLTFVLWLVVGA